MSNTRTLTLPAALVTSILTFGTGALAQSPAGPDAPSNGSDMHHHGMMGDMNRMGPMDMTRMQHMMENCDQMMEGMRPASDGSPAAKPDNG